VICVRDQEISHLSWNRKVHYRVRKIMPILSQMNLVHILKPYFKTHLTIILPSTSSGEVKELMALYLQSPSTPSWLGAQLEKAHGQLYLYLYA